MLEALLRLYRPGSALLAATPLIALAVLIYLVREIAISAARIDGWAEANFELDRLNFDQADIEPVDIEATTED